VAVVIAGGVLKSDDPPTTLFAENDATAHA